MVREKIIYEMYGIEERRLQIYRRFDKNIQLETIQIYKVNFQARRFDAILCNINDTVIY